MNLLYPVNDEPMLSAIGQPAPERWAPAGTGDPIADIKALTEELRHGAAPVAEAMAAHYRQLNRQKQMFDQAQRMERPLTIQHGDVELRGLRFEVVGFEFRATRVNVCAIVSERETGQPLVLSFEGPHGCPLDATAEERAEALKAFIMRNLEHELDELIFANGKRVADPHAGERELERFMFKTTV